MADEKKGGYGLLDKLNKVKKLEKKTATAKPAAPPKKKEPVVEASSKPEAKKPLSAPSGKLDLVAILQKKPEEEKKEEGSESAKEEDFAAEAEERISQMLGEDEDDIKVPVFTGVSSLDEDEDEIKLPSIPVDEDDTYEDFEVPDARMPESAPEDETEEGNGREVLSSVDVLPDDVNAVRSEDVVEESEIEEDVEPPPLSQEELAKLPPLPPQPRELEPLTDLFASEKDEPPAPAPSVRAPKKKPAPRPVQLRPLAHTIPGTRPKVPGEESDSNSKAAHTVLETLGSLYEDYVPEDEKKVVSMIARAYIAIEKIKDDKDRIEKLALLASREAKFGKLAVSKEFLKGAKAKFEKAMEMAKEKGYKKEYSEIEEKRNSYGLDKPVVLPRVTSDSLGFPRITESPAEDEDAEEISRADIDTAEIEAMQRAAQEKMPASESMPSSTPKDEQDIERKEMPPESHPMPRPSKPPVRVESDVDEGKETEVASGAATAVKSDAATKAMDGKKDDEKRRPADEADKEGAVLETLKKLEARYAAWGLMEDGKDITLDQFATKVVKTALAKNPQMLASVVAELIKRDDIIRSILFNEKDGLLREIPGEVRGIRGDIDQRVNSLKGLETQVNNLTSAAQEARDAAQEAKMEAEKVAEAKRYTDEQIGLAGEAMEDMVDDKIREAKEYTDEQIGLAGEAMEEVASDKIEEARGAISQEIEDKASAVKRDAVEEARVHTDTQTEAKSEEAFQKAKEYTDDVKKDAVEEANTYADSQLESAKEEVLQKANEHADNVAGTKAEEAKTGAVEEATRAIENAVSELKEKTIEPIGSALRTMLGDEFQKAKMAGEIVDSVVATTVAGALADENAKGIEMLKSEYGEKSVRKVIVEISAMDAEELAQGLQMYNDKGELDVEKTEKIIEYANRILNG